MARMDMSPQKLEFAARIARIEAGCGSKTTVYVGMDETFQLMPSGRARKGGEFEVFRNALYPLSMVVCFGLGVLANAAATWLRFFLNGLPDPGADPDVDMAIQLVSAFCIAMVVAHFLRLRSGELTLSKSLGVVVCMLSFHNAVHLWPEAFKIAFSPMWVGQMLAQTEPDSLLWRGICFTF
jgi:hypothetical protein